MGESISVRLEGFDGLLAGLQTMPRQIPYAQANAVNAVARRVRDEEKQEMRRVFDRPTPYTMNALQMTPARAPESIVATVWLKDAADHYLMAQIEGGSRKLKSSEMMLGGKSVLWKGFYLVPGTAAEDLGLIDNFGNFKRSELIKILSYFSSWGEQGFKANSTDKTRSRMARRGLSESGYRTIKGKVYFMSLGKGHLVGANRGWLKGRDQHLPAGIWQKSGIHGSILKPVLLAVKAVRYKKLFDFYGVAERVIKQYGPQEMKAAIQKEIEREIIYRSRH